LGAGLQRRSRPSPEKKKAKCKGVKMFSIPKDGKIKFQLEKKKKESQEKQKGSCLAKDDRNICGEKGDLKPGAKTKNR